MHTATPCTCGAGLVLYAAATQPSRRAQCEGERSATCLRAAQVYLLVLRDQKEYPNKDSYIILRILIIFFLHIYTLRKKKRVNYAEKLGACSFTSNLEKKRKKER